MPDEDIKIAFYNFVRPEIRKMAMQMEQKFRLHDKERGDPFQPLPFDFLNNRLLEEMEELYVAMGIGVTDASKPPSEVWKESSDCCNLHTMIAVNYEREWKKGKL